jgi:uncharacterized protein YdaU (DUF1376 family)
MADLTRFDFHALRFMKSEDVMAMSVDEVGQYILLLCESWLMGRACTLPNNANLLARLARVETVSESVLRKFPVAETEYGPRRRNETLYKEWQAAEERSISAAERGRKGNESRYSLATASLQRDDSEPSAIAELSPKPNQAVPSQTNPSQYDSGNFKNLAVRYRKAFTVNLSHGSAQKDSYATACREYSEDIVLAAFDEWAPDNMWIKERRHTNGLRQFYEALPAMIDADKEKAGDERVEQDKVAAQSDAITRSVEAGHQEFLEREKQLLQEREETEQMAQGMKELFQ